MLTKFLISEANSPNKQSSVYKSMLSNTLMPEASIYSRFISSSTPSYTQPDSGRASLLSPSSPQSSSTSSPQSSSTSSTSSSSNSPRPSLVSSGGGGGGYAYQGGTTSQYIANVQKASQEQPAQTSGGTTVSTTPERLAILKSEGYTVTEAGAFKQAGEGTQRAYLQNIKGAQYVLSGAQQAQILEVKGDNINFNPNASKTQRDLIVKRLREEGYDVTEKDGQIIMRQEAPQKPQRQFFGTTKQEATSLSSMTPVSKQNFASYAGQAQMNTLGAANISKTPNAISSPAEMKAVQWYDILGSFGADIVSYVPPVFVYNQLTKTPEQKKSQEERMVKYREDSSALMGVNPLLGYASASLSGLKEAFPQTYKTSQVVTNQIDAKAKELGGTHYGKNPYSTAAAQATAIIGQGAFYGLDTYFTLTFAGKAASGGVLAVKAIQAEGLRGAAKVGVLGFIRSAEILGSPTRLVTGLTKMSPYAQMGVQQAVGTGVLAATVADSTGLYKNEFGEGVAYKAGELFRYTTLQATAKERENIVTSASVYNIPYYGARVAQAHLPKGSASTMLELGYKAANVGAGGLIYYSNIKQAEAQGKSLAFGLGMGTGELGLFENFFEGQTIDKIFEGSRIYKGAQAKAAADISAGRKAAGYNSMWSGITPDVDFGIKSDYRSPRPSSRSTSDIKPDAKTDYQSRAVEIRPDYKVDYRNDFRFDIKPDNKVMIRPDNRIDIRPDYRVDIRPPDDKIDYRPDPIIGQTPFNPDFKVDDKIDLKADDKPDQKVDNKIDLKTDFKGIPAFLPPFFSPSTGSGGGAKGKIGRRGLKGDSKDLFTISGSLSKQFKRRMF